MKIVVTEKSPGTWFDRVVLVIAGISEYVIVIVSHFCIVNFREILESLVRICTDLYRFAQKRF